MNYTIKLDGDVSGAINAVKAAGHMMEQVSKDEVKIKLNYDGNIAEFNKVFQTLINKHPSITVQLQYEINKAILAQEHERLDKLLNMKAEVDMDNNGISKARTKVETLTKEILDLSETAQNMKLKMDESGFEKAKEQIKETAGELLKYISTAKRFGFDFDTKALVSKLEQANKYTDGFIKSMAGRKDLILPGFEDLSGNALDDIAKARDRIVDLQSYMDKLLSMGAKSSGMGAGVGADLSVLEEYMRKLLDLVDSLAKSFKSFTGGSSFNKMEGYVKNLNDKLSETVELVSKLGAGFGEIGEDGSSIGKLGTMLEDIHQILGEVRNEVKAISSKGLFNEDSIKGILSLLGDVESAYGKVRKASGEGGGGLWLPSSYSEGQIRQLDQVADSGANAGEAISNGLVLAGNAADDARKKISAVGDVLRGVVYHATGAKWDKFDFEYAKPSTFGAGMHFTDNPQEVERFNRKKIGASDPTREIKETEINLQKCFLITKDYISSISDINDILKTQFQKDASPKTVIEAIREFSKRNFENSMTFRDGMLKKGYQGLFVEHEMNQYGRGSELIVYDESKLEKLKSFTNNEFQQLNHENAGLKYVIRTEGIEHAVDIVGELTEGHRKATDAANEQAGAEEKVGEAATQSSTQTESVQQGVVEGHDKATGAANEQADAEKKVGEAATQSGAQVESSQQSVRKEVDKTSEEVKALNDEYTKFLNLRRNIESGKSYSEDEIKEITSSILKFNEQFQKLNGDGKIYGGLMNENSVKDLKAWGEGLIDILIKVKDLKSKLSDFPKMFENLIRQEKEKGEEINYNYLWKAISPQFDEYEDNLKFYKRRTGIDFSAEKQEIDSLRTKMHEVLESMKRVDDAILKLRTDFDALFEQSKSNKLFEDYTLEEVQQIKKAVKDLVTTFYEMSGKGEISDTFIDPKQLDSLMEWAVNLEKARNELQSQVGSQEKVGDAAMEAGGQVVEATNNETAGHQRATNAANEQTDAENGVGEAAIRSGAQVGTAQQLMREETNETTEEVQKLVEKLEKMSKLPSNIKMIERLLKSESAISNLDEAVEELISSFERLKGEGKLSGISVNEEGLYGLRNFVAQLFFKYDELIEEQERLGSRVDNTNASLNEQMSVMNNQPSQSGAESQIETEERVGNAATEAGTQVVAAQEKAAEGHKEATDAANTQAGAEERVGEAAVEAGTRASTAQGKVVEAHEESTNAAQRQEAVEQEVGEAAVEAGDKAERKQRSLFGAVEDTNRALERQRSLMSQTTNVAAKPAAPMSKEVSNWFEKYNALLEASKSQKPIGDYSSGEIKKTSSAIESLVKSFERLKEKGKIADGFIDEAELLRLNDWISELKERYKEFAGTKKELDMFLKKVPSSDVAVQNLSSGIDVVTKKYNDLIADLERGKIKGKAALNELSDVRADFQFVDDFRKRLSSLLESSRNSVSGQNFSEKEINSLVDKIGRLKQTLNDLKNRGSLSNIDFSADEQMLDTLNSVILKLKDSYKQAADAAATVVDGAVDGTKKAQKSNSPSKVAEALGEFWGEGYANGIKKHKGDVEDAVRQLVLAGTLTVKDLQNDLESLLSGQFKGKYKALQTPLQSVLASLKGAEAKTEGNVSSVNAKPAEIDMAEYIKSVKEAAKAKLEMLKASNRIDEQYYKRTGDSEKVQELKKKVEDSKKSFADAEKAAKAFFKSIKQPFDSSKFLKDVENERVKSFENEVARHAKVMEQGLERFARDQEAAYTKKTNMDWDAALVENAQWKKRKQEEGVNGDWDAAILENVQWEKKMNAAIEEQVEAFKKLYDIKLSMDALNKNTHEGQARLAILRDEQQEQLKIIENNRKITEGSYKHNAVMSELAEIQRKYRLQRDVITGKHQDKEDEQKNKQKAKEDSERIKTSYEREKELLKEIYDLKVKNVTAAEAERQANEAMIKSLGKKVGDLRANRSAEDVSQYYDEKLREYVLKRKSDVYSEIQKNNVKTSDNANKQAIQEYKNLIKVANEYYSLRAKESAGIINDDEKRRLAELVTKWKDATAAKGAYATAPMGKQASIDNLEKIRAEFNDLGQTVSNNLSSKFSGYVDKLTNAFQDDTKYVKNFREEMQKLAEDIKTLISQPIDLNSEQALKTIASLEQRYGEFVRRTKSSSDKLAGDDAIAKFNMKVSKFIEENSAMTNAHRRILEGMIIPVGSETTIAQLRQMTAQFVGLEAQMIRSREVGKSFFDTLKQRVMGLNAQMMAYYFSWMDWIRYTRQTFNLIKELDYALVDLRKTTKMNTDELNEFYYGANDIAKKLGVTTKEIIEQAGAWSRLGYSTKETAETMAEMSSKFATISPGMSTEEAQTGLISIMKAFHVETDDVQREIMDNINTLGNTMALSNQDLVSAMERSAAALSATGTTLKDSLAIASATQEILQNAEKTGTALKSISLRVRGRLMPPYAAMHMLCFNIDDNYISQRPKRAA